MCRVDWNHALLLPWKKKIKKLCVLNFVIQQRISNPEDMKFHGVSNCALSLGLKRERLAHPQNEKAITEPHLSSSDYQPGGVGHCSASPQYIVLAQLEQERDWRKEV